jgi:uncharacterized protein YcgI (DUF1989 family)
MPLRVGDLILCSVIVRLRLTDYQLAVVEALTTAESLGELAARALDHTTETQTGTRPRIPVAAHRPDDAHFDRILPAATAVALPLSAGHRLRVQQLKDGQCVDLRAFEPGGRTFSAARTRAEHGINPTVGASLWSTAPEIRLMSITADTAPGHDLTFPPCSEFEYQRHFGIPGHLGCAELHAHTQAGNQQGNDVFNLWLPSAVDEQGWLHSWPAACRRDDYIDLKAESDVVVTLSACPDDLFGSSQYEPGPVRVIMSGNRPPKPPPSWPTGPPSSALARNELPVDLPEAQLLKIDEIAASGWLGHARAAVLRAMVFRYVQSFSK